MDQNIKYWWLGFGMGWLHHQIQKHCSRLDLSNQQPKPTLLATVHHWSSAISHLGNCKWQKRLCTLAQKAKACIWGKISDSTGAAFKDKIDRQITCNDDQ